MTRGRLVSVGFVAAAVVLACAPDPGPFFLPQRYPEDQRAFEQGRIGLLTPALNREDELRAFRQLSGTPAVAEPSPTGPASPPGGVFAIQAWMQARQKISDPRPPAGYIGSYRAENTPTHFLYFPNCLDDAFRTAATTLADRKSKYQKPDAFTAWVAAQDQVFLNCGGPKASYPDPAPAGAPALVRQDRDYQIAAAHFYAIDLPEAEKRFHAIAAETGSPWQHLAAYAVGRTLLREATLQNNTAAIPLARAQFSKIASDSSAGSLAVSAKGMIEHLNALADQAGTMVSLSAQLLAPHPPADAFDQALRDSAYILTADSFQSALAKGNLPEPFDWVHTLGKMDGDHATQQWRSHPGTPWLTLATILARGADEAAPALIQSARTIPAESPAYGTVSYNYIRLEIERGQTRAARQALDPILARVQHQPPSLVNGWRAERARVATSFDDFLRWATRTAIGADAASGISPVLGPDIVYVLNFKTPLKQLAVAAHSRRIPEWSASDVAISAWTRAFVLGDNETAADVAPVVARAHPSWKDVTPTEPASEEWRFHAALLIALHREFQPLVTVDYQNHMASQWVSWWCPVTAATEQSGPIPTMASWRLPSIFQPPDAVISPSERGEAAKELAKLNKSGSAQSFLAPIILGWAKSHPDDPLVPQALHRLVMVVRYGCRVDERVDRQVSKAAFDLLHERYPKSEWAKKTPYWFN